MKFLSVPLTIYIRNLVFGVEDGIVSTVGLLSGIAIAGVPGPTIFLTGTVLVFVEAFSMAAGSFLSEESVEEAEARGIVKSGKSLEAGVVMFCSYFLAGFIPLAPYIIYEEVGQAFTISIMAAVAALLVLGVWSGRRTHAGMLRSAIRVAFVGGAAIIVGAIVGSLAA